MSHKHTVIEPASGLTVLAGPNNCGKSAVVDALRTVCGLNQGDYMVRHGARRASVRITTADGHEVVWTRDRQIITWQIDGREVHRSVPEDLHDHLRLPLVQPEGTPMAFAIHFADQKQPLFLLGMPGSAPAVFFAAASDARHFITMRKAQKQRETALAAQAKALAKDKERAQGFVDTLEPVPDLQARLEAVEAAYDGLRRSLDQARQLQGITASLAGARAAATSLQDRVRVMADLAAPPALLETAAFGRLLGALGTETAKARLQTGLMEALAPLLPPPELAPTGGLARRVAALTETLAQIAGLQRLEAGLAGLEAPPALQASTPLAGLVQDLERQSGLSRQAGAQAAALAALAPPPALADSQALEQFTALFRAQDRQARALAAQARCLAVLPAPPALADPEPLKALGRRLRQALAEAGQGRQRVRCLEALQPVPAPLDTAALTHRLATLEQALAAVNGLREQEAALEREHECFSQEVRRWLDANGTCPACGQDLSEAALLGGGVHGH